MPFFRLIRMPNLIIVVITQSLLYFFVLLPIFKEFGIRPQLNLVAFFGLSLVTILITAGGYIINDLLDQESDAHNKPERQFIGNGISEQVGTWLYAALGFLGFFLAVYLGFSTSNVQWIGLYPLSFLFLYWYSKDLKHRPLWGNLLVSLFCAGVAGIIWLAEWESYLQLQSQSSVLANKIEAIFIWYMSFAFLATMYREIIKDLEDLEGDRAVGSQTMPIAWGIGKSKLIAAIFASTLIALLVLQMILYKEVFNIYFILFCSLAILLPLVYSLIRLRSAQNTKEFKILSKICKLILLNGVLLLLFIQIS